MHHLIWRISHLCRTMLWSRYWFPRCWSGSGWRCCVGFDWKCEVKTGSNVTFDNLFTSLPSLDELTALGIGILDTLRESRFHGAPVVNRTTPAKKPRGSYDFSTNGKNLVVSWLDNKIVTCATNYVTCNPVSTALRWSNSNKKWVDVPMLNFLRTTTSKWVVLICLINLCQHIEFALGQRNGGVLSLHEWQMIQRQMHGTIFTPYKSNKVVMLEFQKDVVMTILSSFGRKKPAKSLVFPRNVASNVKIDTKNPILVNGISKYYRCKYYVGRSIYLWQKCNVALHPDCFKDYHSWNTKLLLLFPIGRACLGYVCSRLLCWLWSWLY